MKEYNGFIPPCGKFCGTCEDYISGECSGAEDICESLDISGIYNCCINVKKLRFCNECSEYPCGDMKDSYNKAKEKLGQNIYYNLNRIKQIGEKAYIKEMNEKSTEEKI